MNIVLDVIGVMILTLLVVGLIYFLVCVYKMIDASYKLRGEMIKVEMTSQLIRYQLKRFELAQLLEDMSEDDEFYNHYENLIRGHDERINKLQEMIDGKK